MSDSQHLEATREKKDGEFSKSLTLAQSISKTLASEILSGVIPPGTKLDEPSLAERFDVSRSPVRDALRHLTSMRLVEHLPRRGFTTCGIDEDDLKDLYEGLTEVEAVCAGLCAMRATPIERSKIQALFQQTKEAAVASDHRRYVELNDQFHAAIYAGAHNLTLAKVANELRMRLTPLRIQPFFQKERLIEAVAEHETLVQAIMKQDKSLATQAMLTHAARTGMNVIERMRATLSK